MHGHPNIIRLLNTFQHQSKQFLVFELMQQNLLELVQKSPDGKLEKEQVRQLVFQMVKALIHMHKQNV
jgi:serine/threonine protein kinase